MGADEPKLTNVVSAPAQKHVALAKKTIEYWEDTHAFKVPADIKHDMLLDFSEALSQVEADTRKLYESRAEIIDAEINKAYERGKAEALALADARLAAPKVVFPDDEKFLNEEFPSKYWEADERYAIRIALGRYRSQLTLTNASEASAAPKEQDGRSAPDLISRLNDHTRCAREIVGIGDEELLKRNKKYVDANKSRKNTFDCLDYAYYHGQLDLMEELNITHEEK